MPYKSYSLILVIIFVCKSSLIYSEPPKQLSSQNYNIPRIISDASSQIRLIKSLHDSNKINDLEKQLQLISGQNLYELLTEIQIETNASEKCMQDLSYTFDNLLPIGGWASKSKLF